jgi:hypothetical protein
MHNDSIETLLLRHYGRSAPAPVGLEERLVTSVRQQAVEQRWQQNIATHLRERRISRRNMVRFVALASAGAGALSIGVESVRALEGVLTGQGSEVPQSAFS